MQILKNVRKWGNSSGILLPREWLGKQVKIILVDRTEQVKKEIFDILNHYLFDIIGIYLVGSYARAEQKENSDIDIIAISNNLKKEIISGKYHVSIYTLDSIKKTLKENPIMIYPRLIEAKTILNDNLIKELKLKKINKKIFKRFYEDCKRIIKINREIINLDTLEGDYLKSIEVIYSIILRLRGIFFIKCILENKKYSNKLFKKWLIKNIPKLDYKKIYNIYKSIRDDKKVKEKIYIQNIEILLNFLEKEVKKYAK